MAIQLTNIDAAWDNFLLNSDVDEHKQDEYNKQDDIPLQSHLNPILNIPKPSDIYISTKTIIAYLNTPINLREVFWNIPIINYADPNEGIIKKQMKFNTTKPEDLEEILSHIKETDYIEHHIISSINNPEGRIKFKDVRKISIGLCKKDIISYRCKKKSAFYNCFVVILRLKYNDIYKEIHVKVFNTGKLEIPGIQDNALLDNALTLLTKLLNPYVINNPEYKIDTLEYVSDNIETVLINSNFNCGFYIDREKLYDILKYKYNINCGYDPCSYPGIQCEFYYIKDKSVNDQDGKQPHNKDDKEKFYKVSFMVFRTGSVLIVGKCDEDVLINIYIFIKDLLAMEFEQIGGKIITSDLINEKKKKKIKKKIIIVDNN
jgi:hypothetical protein